MTSDTLIIPTDTELAEVFESTETREVRAYLNVTVTDDDREPVEEAVGGF
ncbi:hypothetical protein ACIQB5_48155 [Streptomyces sp. NPDC088560]